MRSTSLSTSPAGAQPQPPSHAHSAEEQSEQDEDGDGAGARENGGHQTPQPPGNQAGHGGRHDELPQVRSCCGRPAGEPGKPWPEGIVSSAASIADLYVTLAASKADPGKPVTVRFPRLAPGKYEVWSGDMKVDVEVKPNETAKVELKKK